MTPEPREKKNRQTYSYHNCAFAGYDEVGKPRYCALRASSADSSFPQDVENSDKIYGFCMKRIYDHVYAFEAPINAMSNSALCKLHGIDWRQDHRIVGADFRIRRYIAICKSTQKSGKLFCSIMTWMTSWKMGHLTTTVRCRRNFLRKPL